MNLIVSFIKKIFKLKLKEENKSNIKTLKVGDIIWAKRYADEEEKNLIEKGHQMGPFIVLKTMDDNVLCSAGKSTLPKEEYSNMYININNSNLYKKTYFKLKDFVSINDNTFIRKIGSITDNELNKLFSKIKYLNKRSIVNDLNFPLQVGDIINYKNIYYIILDKEDSNIFCLPIKKKYNKESVSSFKDVNFSSIIKLNTLSNINYVSTISDGILINLLKRQNQYLKSINNRTIAQRGSVVKYNDEYYYIYGENGSDWLLFKIFKDEKNSYDKIVINDNIFYTIYEDEAINKKSIESALMLAYDDQIEDIKQKKKTYKKTHENVSDNSNDNPCRSLHYKDVIKIDNEEYYVLDFIGEDILKCVNKRDLNKKLSNAVYIRVSEISPEQIVKSKVK